MGHYTHPGYLQLCPPGSEQVPQTFPGLLIEAVTDQPRSDQECTPFTAVYFYNKLINCNLLYGRPSVGVSV